MRGDHKTLAPSRKNVRRTILDVLGASSLALFFFVFEISLSSAVGRRHWQASRHHDRSSSCASLDPCPDLDQLINWDHARSTLFWYSLTLMLRWSASSLSASRIFASMAIFTACFSALGMLSLLVAAPGSARRRSLMQV